MAPLQSCGICANKHRLHSSAQKASSCRILALRAHCTGPVTSNLNKDGRTMEHDVVDTLISPEGRLEVLSKAEVNKLLDTSQGGLYQIFRNCALAVLNCGSSIDDGKELLERYQSFDISIVQRERGIKLEIKGAPAIAFVDGKMIKGIHEHLFAVLRDIVFISSEVTDNPKFNMDTSDGITDSVFHILRNANVLKPQRNPNLVVCWGGH